MGSPVFDWSEYLTLANQLAANSDEASHRSAISRAYYCVYHKASERAVASGCVDPKRHVELWNLYTNKQTDKACIKLATMGDRMKKERVEADYNPAAGRITDRMNVQLRRANDFLARLSALQPGVPIP
jgi:uncharacterized protein (UPF0332 family)